MPEVENRRVPFQGCSLVDEVAFVRVQSYVSPDSSVRDEVFVDLEAEFGREEEERRVNWTFEASLDCHLERQRTDVSLKRSTITCAV